MIEHNDSLDTMQVLFDSVIVKIDIEHCDYFAFYASHDS